MKLIIGLVFSILLSWTAEDDNRPATIYMIGDSTMADKSLENGNLERGWGQALPDYLTTEIRVENHAVNGRSSKSFIDEGRWEVVLGKLLPGDYVFIQFGHNDEKTAPEMHTIPGGSFDKNLKKFIQESRDKGAIPVLFNSIVRRNYPPEGCREHKYTYETEGHILVDTHGEYSEVPRRIAGEMNVPFVDLTRLTHDLIAGLGPQESKKLFMWVPAGQYESYPNGKIDNTHLNAYGAGIIAYIAIEAVIRVIPELSFYVRNDDMSNNE